MGREIDNTEKPVREQLQKTTIAAATDQQPASTTQAVEALRKKRSFEEINDSSAPSSGGRKQPTRKRSRDSAADVDDDLRTEYRRTSQDAAREGVKNGNKLNDAVSASAQRPATPESHEQSTKADDEKAGLASPKIKRSRLGDDNGVQDVLSNGSAVERVVGEDDAVKAPSTAAKEPPQTSNSAFAASGFGALASSTSSGFGALGKGTSGFGSGAGFASPSKSAGSATSTSGEGEQSKAATLSDQSSTTSTFGGALGARSAFSSTAGTGSFGGGLGRTNAIGTGSGFGSLSGSTQLASFASKGSAAPFSSTMSSKPFGAPADDADDADEAAGKEVDADEGGIRSPVSVGTEEGKKDARFYEQKVETGEESENVVYQSRAKLYNWTTTDSGRKEWKERGFGVLKLNAKSSATDATVGETDDGDRNAEQKVAARLLLRADGSHRVLLNSPIKKELKVESAQGGPPANGQMVFMGTIDGKSQLELLQLKMRPQFAIELYEKIIELQTEM